MARAALQQERYNRRRYKLYPSFLISAASRLLPSPLGVFGANMGCKLLVALQLKVPHHFIERFASGRAGRFEDPGAFGAAPTAKTLSYDPYQLSAHSRLCPHRRPPRVCYSPVFRGEAL